MIDDPRRLADLPGDGLLMLAKSSPSLTAVGMTLAGIGMQDWLAICGMLFIALQAAYQVWKWRREARRD